MIPLVYEKMEGSSLIQMGWVEVENSVGLNLGSVVEQPWLLYFSTSGFSCQGMLVHRGTGNTRTRRIAPCHHLGAYHYKLGQTDLGQTPLPWFVNLDCKL